MNAQTKTRTGIAALIFMMASGVLFGIGVVTVLTAPALSEQAAILIPIVVALSLVLAVPIAWWMAPRLRARYWRAAPMRSLPAHRPL